MSAEKLLTLTRRDFLRGAFFIGGGLLLNRCMPTPEPTPPAPTDVPMALAPGGETTVVAIQREMNATALAETSTPTPKPADTPTVSPTATETSKPTSTPEPTATSTPETIKVFDCDILSPEACATGEYIQWKVSSGLTVKGVGFTLKEGEEIKIPKKSVVAGSEYKQPHTYNGFGIKAIEGGVVAYYVGNIEPVGLTNVGKEKDGGTVVGKIKKNPGTVFKDTKYNLVIFFSSEKALMEAFPDQITNSPIEINNQSVKPSGGSGKAFY
jgi:hypothetical protein